ncbi:unnamed protein product [Spirodela intermedia]|uniref:TF-B3 domain-containing protein n=1 Tax=Spirodela intermedia TaxID=51605 RepID=A0A7I8K268_SPIIN|nr:unnamed protein product [Spirodela intermedia]
MNPHNLSLPFPTINDEASPVLLRGAMDSRASSSSKTARAAKSKDKGKAVVEAIPLSQMMVDENRSFISQYRAHPSPTRGAAVAAPWSCTRFSGSSSSRALGNNESFASGPLAVTSPSASKRPGVTPSVFLLIKQQRKILVLVTCSIVKCGDGCSNSHQQCEVEEREWILILHKVLQKTDVGGLHRIILPKRDAEANLPRLENVGTVLEMLDMAYHITWKFKYRFWPGSKSRVYVLENTEKFVKKHKLEAGDRIGIYRKETSKHYVVRREKTVGLPD